MIALTDARLAEIEARSAAGDYIDDAAIDDLLAEVKRLREQRNRLRNECKHISVRVGKNLAACNCGLRAALEDE